MISLTYLAAIVPVCLAAFEATNEALVLKSSLAALSAVRAIVGRTADCVESFTQRLAFVGLTKTAAAMLLAIWLSPPC